MLSERVGFHNDVDPFQDQNGRVFHKKLLSQEIEYLRQTNYEEEEIENLEKELQILETTGNDMQRRL